MKTKYKIYLAALLSSWIVSSQIIAQDSLKHTMHSLTLKTAFFQIKDDFTYGLVFNGVNLSGRYSFEKNTEKATLMYAPEISFGANYNIGVGLALGFVPIDVFYGYKTKVSPSKPIVVGAYFSTNYNWQFYPELQGGHMYWFTSFEIGPQLIFTFPLKNTMIKITFSNSLAGFTSRPEPQTESYFTSRKFSDFVSNAHSHLQFGSFESFNHTNFEIVFLRKDKKLNFAYEFDYFGYFKKPRLQYLSHAINLIWKMGQ